VRRKNMKRSLFLVLSISLVMGLANLIFSEEKTDTYANEDIGFSLEYPASWAESRVQGANIVVFFSGGAINRNVQVMYDHCGEEGGMAVLENLANILNNQRVISSEWKEVNGRRSFFQIAEWTSILGGNRAIRLMVPSGDHYFLVMGVCPAEEVGELSPLLERCILSFRITD
jgi:hypothetical protein